VRAAEVLAALPKLSDAELDEVVRRVAFLRKGKTSSPTESYNWLIDGAVAELKRRGLSGYLPKTVWPSQQTIVRIQDHLSEGLGKVSSGVERQATALLAVRTLCDYLIKINIPLTPKTVLANLDKIPQALEDSFPGYWRAGLLMACVSAATLNPGMSPREDRRGRKNPKSP
jgi:hypothetical protein